MEEMDAIHSGQVLGFSSENLNQVHRLLIQTPRSRRRVSEEGFPKKTSTIIPPLSSQCRSQGRFPVYRPPVRCVISPTSFPHRSADTGHPIKRSDNPVPEQYYAHAKARCTNCKDKPEDEMCQSRKKANSWINDTKLLGIYSRSKLENETDDEGLRNLMEFIKSVSEEDIGIIQFRGRFCNPKDGGGCETSFIGEVVRDAMSTGFGLRGGPLALYWVLKEKFPGMSKGRRSGRGTDENGDPVFYFEIPSV